MQRQIASGLSTTVLPTMLENYRKFGVEQYTGHKVLEIAMGQLVCTDQDGKIVKIPCDSVVIASGARPVTFDTAGLIEQGVEVVMVGDCREVADISYATKTAYDAANAL